jgi:beta-fructofuranosidase
MTGSPLRLAYLYHSTLSPEQRAALEWAVESFPAVEAVTLGAVADGLDLDRYDACWWHCDRDPSRALGSEAELATPVERYLEDGGGLVLTLRALEAVTALGVDPIAPDDTGVDHPGSSSGLLVHPLYEDHPAFAGFDRLRIRTHGPAGPVPYARYGALLPAEGHVLAGGFVDEADRPADSTAVWWPRGSGGGVLGIGASLAFADRVVAPYGMAGAWLIKSALEGVASGDPTAGMAVPPRSGYGTERHLRAMRDGPQGPGKPTYHLTPPANWLNDPNGLVYHDDRYHVFYQYNPGGPYHGSIHWGHASSPDLVHWRDERVALSPDPDGPDRDGCWSGCTVVTDEGPVVLYTGGRGRDQLPCRATPLDDDLLDWAKDPTNPVIPDPPSDPAILATEDWAAEFRDHNVWREGDRWYQLVGTGLAGAGGAVLLYESTDSALQEWSYRGTVLTGDGGHGVVWECPELLSFPAGDLLHVSDGDHVEYFLGELDTDTPDFEVHERGRLDHGDFYAPQSTTTPDGRQLMWGWLPEERGAPEQWDAGWSGAMSVPRETWVADGRVHQRPAAELRGLRGEGMERHAVFGDREPLGLDGRALEIHLTAERTRGTGLELGVLEGPEGTGTRILWEDRGIRVDRSAASEGPVSSVEPQRLPLGDADELSLTVLVDGSVVELFADGRALTSRVYPGADWRGASLRGLGGGVTVDVEAWRLDSMWGSSEGQ